MARSGVAAARTLHALGAIVTVTDKKPLDQLAAKVKTLGSSRITVVAGGHPNRIFIETDLVVLSPGVPKIPQISLARRHGASGDVSSKLCCLIPLRRHYGNERQARSRPCGLMLEQSKRRCCVGTSGMRSPKTCGLRTGSIVAEISSFQPSIETFDRALHKPEQYSGSSDRYRDITNRRGYARP
jgi:hypothetical protein